MASLRARLIAVLLVVAAGGLVALAAITYAEQRSFLLDRVDVQLRSAVPAMEHQLDGRGRGLPPRRGDPPPGAVNLPPGTYGELRDGSGAVSGDPVVITYGQDPPAAPDLPAELPGGGDAFTVDAEDGGEPRYRAVAFPQRGGAGTIVVAVPLAETDATLDRLLLVEALVIAGVLLVLGVVAALLVRLGLRPLDRIGATAGTIAGGDLSRRVSPATPETEVGRLGLALNAMLDRLEEAFARRQESEDRLRRFLSDASHELRTPLASIRGYAELFRMGAARDSEDVEKAMRRIEDEAARMGVLVDDLLALARLDELRDPARERVDLAAVARDAVDDARATAPDRAFELDAAPAAAVHGDPHQLGQVLANLLRNAIVHTPAGTPVEVAVEHAGEQVRVRVRDHGPGLPAAGADAVFDRFWRAEGGRERGKAGAGLGLAIVAAIVAAHHGRVHAADAPGGGACFTVLLPAAGSSPAGSIRGERESRMSDEPISEFSIEEQRRGGTVVLTLQGELDLVTAEQVAARLEALRAAGEPALLDIDDIDFMDSSGLRMVLDAAEASDASGWQFSLTHGPDQVRRLFESTCVTDRLPIVPRPA